MAGFSVKIDAARLRKRLAGIKSRGEHLTPVMRSFGEYMRRRTDERFSGERDPEGVSWPESKTAKKEGRKVLTKKHRLRRSVTYLAGPASLALGTNVVYGRIHQQGGTILMPGRAQVLHFRKFRRGRNKGRTLFSKTRKAQFGMKVQVGDYRITIPPRPYLGFNDADIAEAVTAIKAYILEARR